MTPTAPSPTTLYRNGRVYSPADPRATALLVRGQTIEWLGDGAAAPVADHTVDLAGALVTPAFVDAHVHGTDTGLALSGLDLSGTRSAAQVCDAVAAFAAGLPADAVVLGHGWDDSTWPDGARRPPTAGELDRAAAGRRVYLSQASMHSAACSTALLAAAPDAAATPGFDAAGWLRRDAHHVVRAQALGSVSARQRVAAQRTALRRAAALGIAAVHECGGPGTSDEADFTGLLALGGVANGQPEVYGYWGELLGAAKARELGAVGAGGDLYADGALGSRTAHLSEPYADAHDAGPDAAGSGGAGSGGAGHAGHAGHGYLTADQVAAHLLDCAAHGVQGGFHAIGDAALSTVLAGFGAAARKLGVERVRAARHRVEHAELMDKRLIAGFVEYGIVASMQPAFDRLWGGDSQMYAQRLGVRRSLESNPMGAMHGVGVALAFGSDSPVTPLDPWGTVRAAMTHFNPVHRMSVRAAFAAHTRGGWRAVAGRPAASDRSAGAGSVRAGRGGAGVRGERGEARGREPGSSDGVLVPGAPATFAVWRVAGELAEGLPALVPSGVDEPVPALPACRRTVLRGTVIFDEEDDAT